MPELARRTKALRSSVPTAHVLSRLDHSRWECLVQIALPGFGYPLCALRSHTCSRGQHNGRSRPGLPGGRDALAKLCPCSHRGQGARVANVLAGTVHRREVMRRAATPSCGDLSAGNTWRTAVKNDPNTVVLAPYARWFFDGRNGQSESSGRPITYSDDTTNLLSWSTSFCRIRICASGARGEGSFTGIRERRSCSKGNGSFSRPLVVSNGLGLHPHC